MPHPAANASGDLIHIVELLQQREGKHIGIAFLQIELELFGQIDQIARVLQIRLIIGFENGIALQLAIGQPHIFRLRAWRRYLIGVPALLGVYQERSREKTRRNRCLQQPEKSPPKDRFPRRISHIDIITS